MFPPAGSRFSFFFFYLFFCRHNTQHTTLPAFDHNSIICIRATRTVCAISFQRECYLKAEAECSKKKERYEKYCTKNPTYKRTPQKKYKESSDQEDDESEEYSDREGEECSDEEGEEGDCSVTDNEEDNSGVDDEEDDEDYNEENNEVDISDIADYHTKNLTENFEEGDTNQQKIDKINKKFKVSSLRLHPDKHPSATETKKAELTNSFQVMSNVRTSLIAQLKYKL